jgi:hypothetical protein
MASELDNLKAEVRLEANLGKTNQVLLDELNAKNITQRISSVITKVSIHRVLGLAKGVQLLETLKVLASTPPANGQPDRRPLYAEIIDLLKVEGAGIDVSLDEVRAYIDQFVLAGILTINDANAIKALGEVQISRANQLGYSRDLEIFDIAKARE